jgi:hypothetical protein
MEVLTDFREEDQEELGQIEGILKKGEVREFEI